MKDLGLASAFARIGQLAQDISSGFWEGVGSVIGFSIGGEDLDIVYLGFVFNSVVSKKFSKRC